MHFSRMVVGSQSTTTYPPVLMLVLVLLSVLAPAPGVALHGAIQPQHPFLTPDEIRSLKGTDLPHASYFVQILDHFDPMNNQTFLQRFYLNDAYWAAVNQTGPVFVLVGGENPITPHDVHLGHVAQLGKQFNALIIAIEHRYYGESTPSLPDMSVENLKYLTWMQALEDLNRFLDRLKDRLHLRPHNHVFTFGGSYAGALATWFRLKFPNQVYAAMASSAPVRAEKEFSAYMREVGRGFADESIGGSQHCQERIRQAFREIARIVSDQDGLADISSTFSSCTPLNDNKDYKLLQQTLASFFEEAVQYNNQTAVSVSKICKLFNGHSSSALQHLTDVVTAVLNAQNQTCYDYSWNNYIATLSETKFDVKSSDRQWTYQFCTQFGYYQQCERSQGCIFSTQIDKSFYSDLCSELFGITEGNADDQIRSTNANTGGYLNNGFRIAYVNGGSDPWRVLSVLEDQPELDQHAIVIAGASHCQDMQSAGPSDSDSMKQARQRKADLLTRWMKEADGT